MFWATGPGSRQCVALRVGVAHKDRNVATPRYSVLLLQQPGVNRSTHWTMRMMLNWSTKAHKPSCQSRRHCCGLSFPCLSLIGDPWVLLFSDLGLVYAVSKHSVCRLRACLCTHVCTALFSLSSCCITLPLVIFLLLPFLWTVFLCPICPFLKHSDQHYI